MTKRSARHGGSPSSYTRQKKKRFTYEQVPLHNPNEGLTVTGATIRKFAARHGIVLRKSVGETL